MRVSAAKTAPRIEPNYYLTTTRIKSYGKNNDYPQKVLDIVGSSATGKTCLDIYTRFIMGNGFTDQSLATLQVNEKDTVNKLLRKCIKDRKHLGGFAVLVKYNGIGGKDTFYNVPFEHCRLEINDKKEFTGRVAVHPDWTKETGKTFKNEDIVYLNIYDPTKVAEQLFAEGPEKFKGQIYYHTSEGDLEYPVSPFDPIVTDMLTEESVSTVKHRNAKHNFLPSGILVRKGIKPNLDANGLVDENDPKNIQDEETVDELKRLQGDENACKIWVCTVDADEETPEFIPFDAKNYDKQYEYTEKTVQENIGRMFAIPPILRGVDVGAGFGAELMSNAYNFMSAITTDERKEMEEVFSTLFSEFVNTKDFTIEPLKYEFNDTTGNKI